MRGNLTTAQDFQACVEGDHGQEWSDAADEFIQRTCDWPPEAAWAEWRNIRASAPALPVERAAEPLHPPPGWYVMGHHAALVPVPDLEFSATTGDDGLPLWERPALPVERAESGALVELGRQRLAKAAGPCKCHGGYFCTLEAERAAEAPDKPLECWWP